jgi:hypothetical protein
MLQNHPVGLMRLSPTNLPCDPRLCRFPESENHEAVGQMWPKNLSAKLESFVGAEYERLRRSCQINTSKSKFFNVNNHDRGASKYHVMLLRRATVSIPLKTELANL